MRRFRLFMWLLVTLTGSLSAFSQVRARTEYGEIVLLYPDGTWYYLEQHEPEIHNGYGRGDHQVNIDAGATGKRFAMVVDELLFFFIDNGQLEDIYIYDPRGSLVYSLSEGVKRLPYNWSIQYDTGMERRVRKLGPYAFEYDWHTGRPDKIGRYEIEYRFHDNRVERIGNYRIEYDFRTGRLSRVGNLQIEYEFMTDGIKEIRGKEPKLQLYLLSDTQR